jgi:SAM-dependent methyltransferase
VLTIDFDRLRLAPGSRVLDLGCGDGRHTRATRVLPAIAAVAVDIAPGEVARAAESLRAMDAGDSLAGPARDDAGAWLVLRADGYTLPFADGVFDCVIASEVLEHLHDDDGALAEIRRVLKPDGQLALSVPRWFPEKVCWALSSRYHETEGGHVRIYRRAALRQKLRDHGYEVLGAHYAHALHSPYWWLKCAVGVDDEDVALVRWYHRFLVWDLMKRPRATRLLEDALNPLIGKSAVFYAAKSAMARA